MKRLKGLPFLAARVFGTPLAIWKPKLEVILAALGERIVGDDVEVYAPDGPELQALLPAKGVKPDPQSITSIQDGVAMIDVSGTLVHRSSWMDAVSGLASYENLSNEIDRAVADPNVKAVLLCINSPGGEVSGMFEMAERIQMARGKGKPIHAIAADCACSAAYILGAACEKFYATEGAVTGSIGVVMAHADVSEADKKAGIKVTYIFDGDRKVDGNPHEPLDGEAKDAVQDHVSKTAAIFHARVDKYRGLKPGTAKATQAAVFVGADAQAVGLVDGIKSTRQVLAEIKAIGQKTLPFAATSPGARVSAATTTPSGGSMDPEQLKAALEAMTKERDALKAEVAKLSTDLLEAKTLVAAAENATKLAVVEKHLKAGRFFPAQRADVEILAEKLTADQLDEKLAKWPQVTRPVPTGSPDAKPSDLQDPSGDPLVKLNAIANEIRAKTPSLSFPDAFDQACRANPTLYAAHRSANTRNSDKKKEV